LGNKKGGEGGDEERERRGLREGEREEDEFALTRKKKKKKRQGTDHSIHQIHSPLILDTILVHEKVLGERPQGAERDLSLGGLQNFHDKDKR